MNHISGVLKSQTNTTTVQLKEVNSSNCTTVEIDKLYDSLKDLVNHQYRAWYCKKFYELGYHKVQELASIAKNDGYDPRHYFSILLKKSAP